MQVHALQRTVWPRAIVLALIMALAASGLRAEVTAFKQAVAEAASDDRELARFYRETAYSGLWTGDEPADSDRRKALFAAIAGARAHGFPAQRYDVQGLLDSLKAVRTARDLGFAEVALSKVFLRYATDLQRGMLDKARVLPANKRPTETPERLAHLERIRTANPVSYLRGLAPRTMEYARLMKEKARLEQLVADGGWGPTVPAQTLAPDDAGPAVLALRDRLIRMGYLGRSASATYDAALRGAVQRFQRAHGLEPDGVAGAATLPRSTSARPPGLPRCTWRWSVNAGSTKRAVCAISSSTSPISVRGSSRMMHRSSPPGRSWARPRRTARRRNSRT